jgi:hypothetical protein
MATHPTHQPEGALLRQLMEGQCNSPVRIVSFNTSEGWSRDVSEEVAEELRRRCAVRGEVKLPMHWSGRT